MCNGFSTRTSQGGSIAVLRPTKDYSPYPETLSNEEWRLLFSNYSENNADLGTRVEFSGLEGTRKQGPYWVEIHRDGDLSASTSPPPLNQLPSKLFFSFSLATDPASVMQLPRRLDLGVGDSGIIGRKVSVMTSSTKGPMAVAEGVIGWN